MNLSIIFGPRFQKTLFVYFPLNFSFVIILIWSTWKIFSSSKVPELFLLKLIVKNFYIILPWAFLHAQMLYSLLDVPPKKSSPKADKEIELGPVAPTPKPLDVVSTTPQSRVPEDTLPSEFVVIDLGEGPSNSGLPGPPRPFLTREV